MNFDKVYDNFITDIFGLGSSTRLLFIIQQRHIENINNVIDKSNWTDILPDYIESYYQTKNYFLNQVYHSSDDLFKIISLSCVKQTVDIDHLYINIYTNVKYRETELFV